MANGHFTLWDVVKESVQRAAARKTRVLVVLFTYTLALIATQGLGDYCLYASHTNLPVFSPVDREACFKNIVTPWMIASSRKNLSASQQEEFYQSYKLNCTMLEDPPNAWGTYKFTNGSVDFTMASDVANSRSVKVHSWASSILYLLAPIWQIWALVAMAWGLQGAILSLHRDPVIYTPTTLSRTLAEHFREQFSTRVLRGVIQVGLTTLVMGPLGFATEQLGGMAISLLKSKMLDPEVKVVGLSLEARALVNPMQVLFLLASSAAALETGVWGFKALWRGIKLTRGNRLKSFFIHYLLLTPWGFLCLYLSAAVLSKLARQYNIAPKTIPPLPFFLLKSMTGSILLVPRQVLKLVLVPVFYFFCKVLCEKLASMA